MAKYICAFQISLLWDSNKSKQETGLYFEYPVFALLLKLLLSFSS